MKRIRQIAGASLAVSLVVATMACREPDAPGTQGSPKDWNTMYTGTDTSGGTVNNGGVARADQKTSANAPAGTKPQSAPLTAAPVATTPVTTTTATTTSATTTGTTSVTTTAATTTAQ
jgi:hypothetical protein